MNISKPEHSDTKQQINRHSMPGVFSKLLQENHETHEKLGELSLLTALGKSDVSLEQYLTALKRMYGLYAGLEPVLEKATNWESIGINFNDRRKLPLFEKDFKYFHIPTTELAKLPICKNLPKLRTLSEALGCITVIEGSTAGASATAQKLAISELSVSSDNGGAFFNNYGDRRSEMRANLGKTIAEQTLNESEFLSAGKQTFETFYTWLSQ